MLPFLFFLIAFISEVVGTVAGFGSSVFFVPGLIGTGGAIRGLVLAAFDLEKSTFVTTSAAIDSGVDFCRMMIAYRMG